MLRAAWFAATGLILAIRSLQTFTNPNFMRPVSTADWFAVVSFSVGLVALAAAVPMFAQLLGAQRTYRVSLVPAMGLGLAGISNILEDGMQIHDAFWIFVASTGLTALGLVAFTLAIVVGGIARGGAWAAVPAATLAGYLTFPVGGGLLMLGAWLAAAALALRQPVRAKTPA